MDVVGEWFVLEIPEHRTELEFVMERNAMVDRPDPTIGAEEAVSRLAIRVVDHEVEGADLPEHVVVLITGLVQGEVVLVEMGRHEELERARVGRRIISHDGGRYDIPPEIIGDEEGCHLALIEPAREVPQRPLAPMRLVDRLRVQAFVLDVEQERCVRRVRHTPDRVENALA